jgi:hypothetical protein
VPTEEVVAMTTLTIRSEPSRRTERRNLVRHFFEMVGAMLVGMAVLGMVVRAICTALGHSDYLLDHVGLRAPVMAVVRGVSNGLVDAETRTRAV